MNEDAEKRLAFRLGFLAKLAEENMTVEDLTKRAAFPFTAIGKLSNTLLKALMLYGPFAYGALLGWGAHKITEPSEKDIEYLRNKIRLAQIERQLEDVHRRIEYKKRLARKKSVAKKPEETESEVENEWSFK